MSLTSDEQKLADAANAVLPEWFSASGRVQEEVGMMAKQHGAILAQGQHQIAQLYIGTAAGPTGSEPDWLDMLAQDRGTHRQANETTAVLRERLQRPPSAVVRSEVLAEVQAMVDASTTGITTPVAMVEFPRDAAHLGTWVQDVTQAADVGGRFLKSSNGTTMTFIPNRPFVWTPYVEGISGQVKAVTIQIFFANSAGNDGSFLTTDIVDDGSVTYENANGVAEVDAVCGWATFRLDFYPARLDLHAMAFCDRGFRCWRGQTVSGEKKANGGFLIILPYGCNEALRLSVREMLRQKKAAGFTALVERRQSPET